MSGIIVGIDGSGHSERALEWAMKEAALRSAPLTVLTVHEIAGGHWGSSIVYPDDHWAAERMRRLAQEETDKALAGLADPRPGSVLVTAVSGIAADELIRASRDSDLVVMGSRGAGRFTRLLMGSTSAQVARHAYCPVVIIPAEDHR